MFFIMQVIVILITMLITYKFIKKEDKSIKKIICLVIIINISAFISNIFINNIELPSETITITALKEKNDFSQNYDIVLDHYYSSEEKGYINQFSSGLWYVEDNKAIWNTNIDKSIDDLYTRKVQIELPIGINRYIVFETNNNSGKINIEYDGVDKIHDLYSENEDTKVIRFESSDRVKMYYVKGIRFLGWFALFVVIFGVFFYLLYFLKIKTYSNVKLFYWIIFAILSICLLEFKVGNFVDIYNIYSVYAVYCFDISLKIWIVLGISYLFSFRKIAEKGVME